MTYDEQAFAYEKTVTVNALPATVFEALTSGERLQHLFLTRAETEPRPGGTYKFAWDFADAAQNGTQQGKFLDVVPDQKVSYTWEASPAPAPLTTVIFTLAPEGEGTRVSLAHTGFGGGEAGKAGLDHHAGPWDFYLANLKSYLEAGVDNRSAMLGQKTQ